jgi:tol-pal system protein YbgF
MKNLTFIWFLFALIMAKGCVTMPEKQQPLHDQYILVLQLQEKQIENQQDIQERLEKLELSLENFAQKLSLEFAHHTKTVSSDEIQFPKRKESQHLELEALKEAHEVFAFSLDNIANSEKENAQKIYELQQHLAKLKTIFQYQNIQMTVEAKQSLKHEKDENLMLSERSENISPEFLYERALEAFDKFQYQQALDLWTEITLRFPEHKAVSSAYFWQGESSYQMQDFKNAISKYDKVIRKYPDSNKYPAALLRQGLSYYALNNHQDGRLRLQKLLEKFPNRPETMRAEFFLNRQ